MDYLSAGPGGIAEAVLSLWQCLQKFLKFHFDGRGPPYIACTLLLGALHGTQWLATAAAALALATDSTTKGMPCTQCARSAHAVRTQCTVLYVGNYPNPSFGPFAEVCCSIVGFFKLLMHSGYDKFELSFIITYFHPFVPIFTPPFFACSSL